MLSSKRANGSTPRSSAAELTRNTSRFSDDRARCNEVFEPISSTSGKIEVSKLVTNEIQPMVRAHDVTNTTKPTKPQIALPSPQTVGVFGVDANKRINLWNDSAAAVTGASRKETEGDDANCHSNSNSGVYGMLFDEVFPPSSFEVSSKESSGSLVDVLDDVFRTMQPSMAVTVISKAGRKRGRDEITDSTATTSFTVDLLPQIDPGNVPLGLSGVVLVCKTVPKTTHHHLKRTTKVPKSLDQSLMDIARSLTAAMDKPRSLSACSAGGSSGTCITETPTETETTDIGVEEGEDEIEIDNSYHTCQCLMDNSFRSCQVDSSYHAGLIDQSLTNGGGFASARSSRLEPFDASDSEAEISENDPQDYHQLPSPPLLSPPHCQHRKSRRSSSTTDCENEDFRTLFETIDAVIFGVDLSGNINEWNHKMEDLTGIFREDAIGRSILEDTSLPLLPFPSPDCRPPRNEPLTLRYMLEPVLAEAYEGLPTTKIDIKLIAKALRSVAPEETTTERASPNAKLTKSRVLQQLRHDKLKHLVMSVSPRYNKSHEVIGAIFLASDQSEGFTKFLTMKTDAHELRKLIDTANAPIFGIDSHGYVNEWNEKTAEITGYGKDDAFGSKLVETFVLPEFQESVREILQNALEHGEGTSNYELEFKTKSNETRHLLVNLTPQHDMNNVVVGVVLIAQDVTEAVERDRKVASMALELRQLIETANAPIFGIDVHGEVNEWNTRMMTITGFSKEDALHTPLVENFIAPSMKEKVGEILEAALHGNETSNYEVEVTSKSGEPVFLLVNATTRRDPNKNVTGVVGVAQDVTEDRKHAKALRDLETLRASQEAKVETERNMTAYFAHELRNPLGAIDSALAAMPDKLPENIESLVSGMRLCTKFMSSIMNNLLDVRKMEEGKMLLGKAPVSIRKMLQNVHEMLTPSVKAGVKFRKLINVKGNDWVLGDAHRIEQVMTNVISNAIKYTVSGHIQISIEWEENNVKFICEDTGPGIPKTEQAKLFQRFVQRGGAPGTGLGLAIAKHIVDMTGGSIRFESDPSVKAGTICVVLMALPRCKAPLSSAAKKTEFIAEPLSVLVIDDIKMNRTMVKRRILKGIAPKAKIQEAATGEEALLICGKDKFDVMIVDQYMEGAGGVMVGTDVVFAMRRMRIDSVLIGCSGNDIGTQFFDAGADMVWQKPMPSNDQIIRDLRSCLDKRGIALSSLE